ncbi:MAG: VRR-NUC domain-containing protein [Actinomycetota bacterium]
MKTKKPKLLEKDIQKQIKEYLELNKWKVYRINNMGVWRQNIKRFTFSGTAGLPDLLAVKKGFPLLLCEVKRKGGIVSDAQKDFIKRVQESDGSWAGVYYSLDEIIETISALNDHYK